ncbi:MAG: CRISPR-associated endonuclease Cas2 [Azonexus sp.]|jgi:CRISPR-associated protein Cas2|uniref:CRISPR-associated endonuclease Cas2 n=1 Tax=Azonexus sp. TaxID=1872668 RepID=UPI00281A098F|nr:CRISPR-associated endonuclease Cas2 [Azonexus sp.]MDR0776276.1 CRISPR-associated endonuclease Cas2 [Azonexus sp.]
MDTRRDLYLIAYDVRNPRRLSKIHRFLTGFKVGGQKSVFEIWATTAELRHIRAQLEAILTADEDRIHILALDPRMKPRCFGRAATFGQDRFIIV